MKKRLIVDLLSLALILTIIAYLQFVAKVVKFWNLIQVVKKLK